MFKRLFFLVILFFLKVINTFSDSLSYSRIVQQMGFGISWQSTLFVPFDWSSGSMEKYGFMFFPYNYESNTQGLGVDINYSLGYKIYENHMISFLFNPRLRYDEMHLDWNLKRYKEFVVDYHYNFLFQYFTKKGHAHVIEFGYSTHNTGKAYYFENKPAFDSTLINFQYPAFELGYRYKFLKKQPLYAGIKVSYIPCDHPLYPFDPFMTLGFCVYYNVLEDDILFSKTRKGIKEMIHR